MLEASHTDTTFCIHVVPGIPNMAVSADISKPEDVQKMIDDVVSKWGTIHIACNNAGINKNSASEHTSLEEWDQTFNVNLRGTFMCCQVPHHFYILFVINSSRDKPLESGFAQRFHINDVAHIQRFEFTDSQTRRLSCLSFVRGPVTVLGHLVP